MTTRVELEPAYVLHRRPYGNTSLIVDFFTAQYGRQVAIARSARGLKSRYRGRLELFSPMLISWSGRGELKTLGQVEFSAESFILVNEALFCGFYLNEMVMRLLGREDAYPTLFRIYKETLQQLASQKEWDAILRRFEKIFLDELGYGLTLTHELQTGHPIEADKFYQYTHDNGFKQCVYQEETQAIFSGSSLLALHHEQFGNSAELLEAKKLMRLVLSQYLGDKPIKSREIYR